ncbi:hypothetical protein [Limnohabitans sp.]|uniref:hypothetical protein n=1 Tax=Limnohabitans sp. TaxID=1907725 RepID=UPI00286F5B6C|nr:hypothetical protein [Limnohabitans sp.]
MLTLVNKYGGHAKLDQIITDFFTRISNERGLMHYFFNVPLKQVLADQVELMPFVMRKPDVDYRTAPVQTAIRDINVRLPVFEDVLKVLHLVLKNAKVHYSEAPMMAMHIIEVIEETRSRFADTKKSVYKGADINTSVLLSFYRTQGIMSEHHEVTGEIYSLHGFGLAYPLFTSIDATQNHIVLTARASARDAVALDEIQALAHMAKAKVTPLDFSAVTDESGWPTFQARYKVPTQYGVPKRLLQRVTNQFTWRFEEAMKLDTQLKLIDAVNG